MSPGSSGFSIVGSSLIATYAYIKPTMNKAWLKVGHAIPVRRGTATGGEKCFVVSNLRLTFLGET